MTRERITNKQGFLLTVLFFGSNCYSLLFAANTGHSVWICYLLGSLLAIFIARLLCTVLARSDGTLFETLDNFLSRPIGRCVTLILAVYAFLSAATALSIFGRFNQLTALSKTPTLILPLAVILLGVRACRVGIESIARMGSLTFVFAAAVFLIFSLLGLNFLSIDALLPLTPSEPISILRGSLSVFLNQLGDVVLLTVLYPHLARPKTRARAITGGVAVSGGILTVIALITVMTLGDLGIRSDAYPVFTVLSIRSIGKFIQHLEILSSLAMTFFAFFRVSLCLYFLSVAFEHVFDLPDYRAALLPIGLLLATVTQLLYRNMLVLRERLESDLTFWILIPILILLPCLLFLLSQTKRNKHTLGSK